MISIKDIAKAVGVSPSSVSLVLTGKAKEKRISTALVNRIKEAAEQMGYHPNRVAVSLRTGQSKTIGLIVENISNNFFSVLAKTIEDQVRVFGYNVVYCSTENNQLLGKELIRMLYHQQVDGYLITPSLGMEHEIEKLLEKKKPVVFMDRYFQSLDVPYVMVNNFMGMCSGVDHLVKKGYRNILYVTVDLKLMQMNQRDDGFKSGLQSNQLKYNSKNVLRLKYQDTKEEAVAAITNFIANAPKADAIIFATNYLGLYGLQSLKDLKFKMPEDIAMICFDDNDVFGLYNPGITAIAQPIKKIAEVAVSILMSQLGQGKLPNETSVQLATKIITRNST